MEHVASVRLYLLEGEIDMDFPSPDDFLEAFGVDPDYVDEEDIFFRYSFKSKSEDYSASISFDAIAESFQIDLLLRGDEVMTISSEKVKSISIVDDVSWAGVRVLFDYNGLASEARINLRTDPKINWWVIRA